MQKIEKNILLASGKNKAKGNYWKEYLKGISSISDIIKCPKALHSFNYESIEYQLSNEISKSISVIANQNDIGIYLVFLGVFNIMFNRLNDVEETCIFSPVIGDCKHNSYFPVRTVINPNMKFNDFLEKLKNNLINNIKNQDFPISTILEQNTPIEILTDLKYGLIFNSIHKNIDQKLFDKSSLVLNFSKENDSIKLNFKYNTALFDIKTINSLYKIFLFIIQQIIKDKGICIGEINVELNSKKKSNIDFCKGEKGDFNQNVVNELFEENILKHPDKTALVLPFEVGSIFQNYTDEMKNPILPEVMGENYSKEGLNIIYEKYSFNQINQKVNSLANCLLENGVKKNEVIGLITEPSLEMIVGILAIIKVGAVFMPINSEFPSSRIEYMLNDSNANIILHQEHLENHIKFDKVKINLDNPSNYEYSSEKVNVTISPEDPVYLIYTSGTTGNPKGVIIKHENLVNYVFWFRSIAKFEKSPKTALVSSFAFDLGYTALFNSLLNGYELHLLPKDFYLSSNNTINYIQENELTFLKLTPSYYSLLVNSPLFNSETLKSLEALFLGGERIFTKDVEKTIQLNEKITVVNHYGPTEATIGCITKKITKQNIKEYKKLPVIGKPINNTSISIMGKNRQYLPYNIPGEIIIQGLCITSGYLNNPEATFEKYLKVQNNDTILYRTGDIGKYNEDNEIEFFGREDFQVKIGGYRIELEEINKAILKNKQVENSIVVIKSKTPKDKTICAYIVLKKNKNDFKANKNYILREGFSLNNILSKNDNKNEIQLDTGNKFNSIVELFDSLDYKDTGSIVKKEGEIIFTIEEIKKATNQLANCISKNYNDKYALNENEKQRYKRQLLLHDWGIEGQEKIKSLKIFVAGAGGGASPTLTQLALIGFGTIIICDYDVVELSNLNRQFLHDESRIGMSKAISAKETINKTNPNVNVILKEEKLDENNVGEIIGDVDIIFDMFDGLKEKFLISKYSTQRNIPHIIAGMVDINGYAAVFNPPFSPCYHCVFDEKKHTELTKGMQQLQNDYSKNPLAVIPSSLFTSTGFAVNEAVKMALGYENIAYNKFIYFNQRASKNVVDTYGYRSMTYNFSDYFLNQSKNQGFDFEEGWRGNLIEELEIEPDPNCCNCSDIKIEYHKEKNGQIGSGEKSDTKGGLVLVAVENEYQLLISTIGVLRAGKTIVFASPHREVKQFEKLIDETGTRMIITDSRYYQKFIELKELVNRNICVVDIEKLNESTSLRNNIRQENITAILNYQDDDFKKEHIEDNISLLNFINNIDVKKLDSSVESYFPDSAYYKALKVIKCTISNGYYRGEQDNSENIEPSDLILENLQKSLPDYMIPQDIFIIDNIPLTANNKVDYKKLDKLEKNVNNEAQFKPKNNTEKILLNIWSEVLGISKDKIGRNSSFFKIGGHSIKAIMLENRIFKEFNKKITINVLFENPTIKELAVLINENKQETYLEIKSTEKREYYPLSSAQKRIFFLQQMDSESTSYNMPFAMELNEEIALKDVEKCFKQIVSRHDAFRTTIQYVNNEPVQVINNETELEFKNLHETDCKLHSILDKCIKPFNLTNESLIRSFIIELADNKKIWLIDMHHIISDGFTIELIKNEFLTLFNKSKLNPVKVQYKDYSFWQKVFRQQDAIKLQEEYWINKLKGNLPKLNLPYDFKRPESFTFNGGNVSFFIKNKEADKLKTIVEERGGTLYMNMVAIINILLFILTKQKDIIIGSGTIGRPHADLYNTVGMFVNQIILRNKIQPNYTYIEFLDEVIREVVESFKNQNVEFDDLVELLNIERDVSRNQICDVTIAFQNFNDVIGNTENAENYKESEKYFKQLDINRTVSKADMLLFIVEQPEGILINIEYYKSIFKEETLIKFTEYIKIIIQEVINNPQIALSNIEILSESEKEEIKKSVSQASKDLESSFSF